MLSPFVGYPVQDGPLTRLLFLKPPLISKAVHLMACAFRGYV